MAGIYIHVPFCHSKCAYCDFYSVIQRNKEGDYFSALEREYHLRKHEIDTNQTTVYVGGGTPSSLSPEILGRLLGIARSDTVEEYTVEVNPEDITADLCRLLHSCGVNRISMGVQSFADAELAAVSRRHSADRAVEAYNTLRSCGFTNISLDLIYGLPGQTTESFRYSLSRLLELRPEHFSAYILSYEPRTRLTAMLKAGKIRAADDETLLTMYHLLCSAARSAGYEHYEISNFALPGYRSKHNSSYWLDIPYLGLGPGAHSYDGFIRRINPPSIDGYVAALSAGKTACVIDDEDDANRFDDLLITALRTSEGLDLCRVPDTRLRQLLADAETHIRAGRIVNDGCCLRIPEESWPVADSILVDLMQG